MSEERPADPAGRRPQGRLVRADERLVQRLSQRWIERARAQGRTAAGIDPPTASQVSVLGGFRVIAQQALSGQPDRDAKVPHELAANQWYGAFRRPG